LEFYFRNIVRIPSPRNEAMEFGSAVHHALENLFLKMQEGNNTFPPLDDFLGYFSWYMRRHRASFTREQFHRRMEYGLEILKNYYTKYITSFNKIVAIERNFRNVVVDDLLLKGKLDKIEFNGRDALIVDYKTGDPEKSKEKFSRPNTKNPAGGDYWRQAVFYKIMLDHYAGRDWNVSGVVFDFIEPDKRGEYRREKVEVTPMDEALVKEQIQTTMTKIQNHAFYTGCGKEDCHWCSFVKTNKLAVALHDLQEEEPENVRVLLKSL
jgi:DNA helicase-2/ATP-dependent DNA helicase PcrA